jgi:hypothetical protein
MRRRPGFSEVQYRCTECDEVVKRTEDDRFRDYVVSRGGLLLQLCNRLLGVLGQPLCAIKNCLTPLAPKRFMRLQHLIRFGYSDELRLISISRRNFERERAATFRDHPFNHLGGHRLGGCGARFENLRSMSPTRWQRGAF